MELDFDENIGLGTASVAKNAEVNSLVIKPDRFITNRIAVWRIPHTRNGEFFPAILEPYQYTEKAMVLVLSNAYYQGVSIRFVKMATE